MTALEKLGDGDRDAENKLWTCLFPVAYASAKSVLSDKFQSDCEDVATETLADIWDRISKVSDERATKALTASVALNKARDRRRRHNAAKRGGNNLESLEALQETVADGSPALGKDDFIYQLTINEVRDLLIELSANLQKKHRLVLRDHFFEELSYGEIARKRGIAVNSVGVYLMRGLEAMKLAITRQPRLGSELLQFVGEKGIVRTLLPLATAIQIGGWFTEAVHRYFSEESPFNRHHPTPERDQIAIDGDRLEMTPEQLPSVPVLSEARMIQFHESLKMRRQKQVEPVSRHPEPYQPKMQATEQRSQTSEMGNWFIGGALAVGLLLLLLLYLASR